jgi:hypothetical protein
MTFRELYEEYQNSPGGIGPKIYELVGTRVAAMAPTYRRDLYNEGRAWDDDDLLDVHHDVIKTQLIDRAQIAWVFSEPDPITDQSGYEGVLRRLNFLVKRVLEDRKRSYKLLEVKLAARVRKLASTGTIEQHVIKKRRYFHLADTEADCRDLTDGEIIACANRVRHLPRLADSPEDSESRRGAIGYLPKHLHTLVELVLDEAGTVSESDFIRIFQVLFTPFGPPTLVPSEEEWAVQTETKTADALATVSRLVAQYVATLSAKDALYVVGKSQGASDDSLRESVGGARPTLQKMRERISAGLRSAVLDEIDPELLDDALDEFARQCSDRAQAGRS